MSQLSTPKRRSLILEHDPFNTSFGSIGSSFGPILWDTSEILALQGEGEQVPDDMDMQSDFVYSHNVDPDGETEIGMAPLYQQPPEQKGQMFGVSVKEQRPTLFSANGLIDDEEPEQDEPDSFLKFAKQSEPDTDDKVKHWQSSIQDYTPFPEQMEIQTSEETPNSKRISRPSARGRGSDSPAGSAISGKSKESSSYAASDSSFVPDAEDLSSEESFDPDEDVPFGSPASSISYRPNKRRGRPPTKKAVQRRTKVTQNPIRRVKKECRPPPAKRIKIERVPRTPRVPIRIEPLEDEYSDEEDFDYGWEYSEYNDLAPINQIVDECISLPYDPIFFYLRSLSPCFIGDDNN